MEIYFSGTWGTITDSKWTSDDAQAVCRKMGLFRPGIEHVTHVLLNNNIVIVTYACCCTVVHSLLLHIRFALEGV